MLALVLMFLQIVMLLSVSMMQMSVYELRQSLNTWERFHLEMVSANFLRQAELDLEKAKFLCAIPMVPTQAVLAEPLEWWQSVSCSGNFQIFQYYYVVEFLGSDPCALLAPGPKPIAADYFRITLLNTAKNSQLILQSTLIAPHVGELACEGKKHHVTAGRQMWRQIDK